jgi:Mg/Co/Ni transporter MgtE
LDGFSGVDGIVAWISKTTLCPAYAKATVPSALKKSNTDPAVFVAVLVYCTFSCTPLCALAVQATVE